jgi:DNA-binding GntR family transcriptional regulator
MTSHVSDVTPMLDRIMDRDAERARAVAIQHVSSFVRAVAQTL